MFPRIDGGIGATLKCSPGHENLDGLAFVSLGTMRLESGLLWRMKVYDVSVENLVWTESDGRNSVAFFGVYDGHGGKECAIAFVSPCTRIFESRYFHQI